jgi:hypothetical protein
MKKRRAAQRRVYCPFSEARHAEKRPAGPTKRNEESLASQSNHCGESGARDRTPCRGQTATYWPCAPYSISAVTRDRARTSTGSRRHSGAAEGARGLAISVCCGTWNDSRVCDRRPWNGRRRCSACPVCSWSRSRASPASWCCRVASCVCSWARGWSRSAREAEGAASAATR